MEPPHVPASQSKYHHPYFTATEVEFLSEKQRGKLSVTQEEKARQQACGFIEAVGARIGFPRKTIATAQNLYHRFHLFFPRKDFSYHDVSLAALYVSAKMHDTLKKPKDILMVSYAIRHPELAAKSKSLGGEVDMDPAIVEHDRQRLLAVERLILETICFNFTSRMSFPYVIKIGRALRAPKVLTQLAWRVAVDSHRTLVPLEFPPHVVALGSLYVAALLLSFEQPPSPPSTDQTRCTAHVLAGMLAQGGDWEAKYQANLDDIEELAHAILDLLIQAAQNPLANASPSTPTSPSPHVSASHLRAQAQVHAQSHPPPYKPDQLTRLKIHMREAAAQQAPNRAPRVGLAARRGGRSRSEIGEEYAGEDRAAFGRNEGTIRFLFGPAGIVGGAV